MSVYDHEEFTILLDRLIESERERAKYDGVSDLIGKEIQRVVDESRRLQRLINDRQDLSSVNFLLMELRDLLSEAISPDIRTRINAAIELTDPIPF